MNGNKKDRTASLRGSYTVEASVIIPMFLFLMITTTSIGIDLYHEAEAAQEQERTSSLWAVEKFYAFQAVDEVIDNWKEK